jgi:excisionase family DNA binding protein
MHNVSAIAGYLTIHEVAELHGVSHSLVARYIREKRLQAVEIGNQKLIPEPAAKSFSRGQVGRPKKEIPQPA